MAGGKSSTVSTWLSASTERRSMTFRSSRMLPGHGYLSKHVMASGVTCRRSRPPYALTRRKCSTRNGMSSVRSRSAGMWISMTAMR